MTLFEGALATLRLCGTSRFALQEYETKVARPYSFAAHLFDRCLMHICLLLQCTGPGRRRRRRQGAGELKPDVTSLTGVAAQCLSHHRDYSASRGLLHTCYRVKMTQLRLLYCWVYVCIIMRVVTMCYPIVRYD